MENNTFKENERLLEDTSNEETDTSDLKKASFVLYVDRFSGSRGELTLIVGKIGSGKSSLLYSILGEMNYMKNPQSSVFQYGTIGFIGQDPWIINSTVRENIIMNCYYDEEKFKKVVGLCCLDADIKSFERGILQETGENGASLSGGQRTRIAFARCLYQEPDIFIFDDF